MPSLAWRQEEDQARVAFKTCCNVELENPGRLSHQQILQILTYISGHGIFALSETLVDIKYAFRKQCMTANLY